MKTIILTSFLYLSTTSADESTQIVCQPGESCFKPLQAALNSHGVSTDPLPFGAGPTGRMFGFNRSPAASSLSSSSPILFTDTTAFKALNLDMTGRSLVEAVDENKAAMSPSPMLRFGLKFLWPVINNYGCWCYGGDSWPGARDWTGFGPVMDVYDDACKAHHMGFDCIAADAKYEKKTCKPTKTTYTLQVTPQPNGNYIIECADEIHNDWCKSKVCMVDLRFLARHHKLERDNIVPDYEAFGHIGHHNNKGSFNDAVCEIPVKKGTKKRDVVQVCCGDYPYRIWYDINNSRNIKCCSYNDKNVNEDYGFKVSVGKLYNHVTKECCASGVQPIGSGIC